MGIRELKIEDAEELLAYFKNLVLADPERVERISDVEKFGVEDEKNWIRERLEGEKEKEIFALCCEDNGRIVAQGEVERQKRWVERHVAEIRFGVLPCYEEQALEMVESLIQKARESKIEVLIYFHLASQKAGLSIMKKAGFSDAGVLERYYKKDGKYIDRIYMSLIL
jgi:RimJ/RimL family protein N-acetyltransferase